MAKKRSAKRASQSPAGGLPGRVWIFGGAALVLVLVSGLLYLGFGAAKAGSGIEGMKILPDLGRGHQEGDISYASLTPGSGIHNPTWLNCGIYDEPVRTENVIHSMEHGAVWIAYRPDLPAEQVETLRNLVRREQSRKGERLIVLAPKPGLEKPVVATAWRVQLELDQAGDERLANFVQLYQRGPFYPEPGASCTFGGIGTPLS